MTDALVTTQPLLHLGDYSGALLVDQSWTSDILGQLYAMCTQDRFCDMALMSSDEQNLPCHIAIMAASSGYFNKLLMSLSQTLFNAQATIQLGIEAKFLRYILAFIYTGQVLLDPMDMVTLGQTAAFLEMPVLQKLCDDYEESTVKTSTEQKVVPSAAHAVVAAEQDDSGLLGGVLDQVELEIAQQVATATPGGILGQSAERAVVEIQDQSQEQSELPFVCQHSGCNRRFRRRDTLNIHKRVHTGERPYQCQQCDKSYKQRAHLREHMRSHTGEKPYECKECNKRFSSFSHFSRHRVMHVGACRPGANGYKNGIPGFTCSFCGKVFIAKAHHQSHENKHRGMYPHKCAVCSEQFVSRHKAYSHEVLIHNMHKSSKCPECQKVFVNKGHFNEHLRSHTGEKPFLCLAIGCDKRYSRKKDLTKHMQTFHSGEEPVRYQCDKCDKTYSSLRLLNDHQNIHSGRTPHVCKECGQHFQTYPTYYRHLSQHKPSQGFFCLICGRQFAHKESLKAHKKNFHPDGHVNRYPCEHCSKRFRLQSALRRHIQRVHSQLSLKEVGTTLPSFHDPVECDEGTGSQTIQSAESTPGEHSFDVQEKSSEHHSENDRHPLGATKVSAKSIKIEEKCPAREEDSGEQQDLSDLT